MRICQPHWDALRAAIQERGLSALVPDSGEKAAANLAADLAGEPASADNFDPLMAAHWALVGNCDDLLTSFGQPMTFFMPSDDEHPQGFCPLCRVIEFVTASRGLDGICLCGCGQQVPEGKSYEAWIGRAADDQVAAWKALGT